MSDTWRERIDEDLLTDSISAQEMCIDFPLVFSGMIYIPTPVAEVGPWLVPNNLCECLRGWSA